MGDNIWGIVNSDSFSLSAENLISLLLDNDCSALHRLKVLAGVAANFKKAGTVFWLEERLLY